MRVKIGWGGKVGIASAGMVAMLMFVPVTTSLGQGISENIVEGWEGRYDQWSHQYYCRFILEDNEVEDVRIGTFPRRWLTSRGSHEFWETPLDKPAILFNAYAHHPLLVEKDLGTRNNVAHPLFPFPGSPVAYSASFLNAMAQLHFNPQTVSGPNIRPGSVQLNHLTDGMLQIDTKADDNTLLQLGPRQIPWPLRGGTS